LIPGSLGTDTVGEGEPPSIANQQPDETSKCADKSQRPLRNTSNDRFGSIASLTVR
jgi:hypothetical protein